MFYQSDAAVYDRLVAAGMDPEMLTMIPLYCGAAGEENAGLCCGTEDYLLPHSRNFRDLLQKNGFSVTYEEGPGGHEWDFWDTYIKKALDWLPLNDASQGINSGNVK